MPPSSSPLPPPLSSSDGGLPLIPLSSSQGGLGRTLVPLSSSHGGRGRPPPPPQSSSSDEEEEELLLLLLLLPLQRSLERDRLQHIHDDMDIVSSDYKRHESQYSANICWIQTANFGLMLGQGL